MGSPYFKVEKLIKEHGITVFSSNFSLYKDMSKRMMSLIKETVPNAQIYSIDEAFMDLTGVADSLKLANDLRRKISKGLGLPTAIGLAPTKVLAKVANHIAKNQGVCLLNDMDDIDQALKSLEVGDVWGIGRNTAQKLQLLGITTAFQLKNVNPKWMGNQFTVSGERLVLELNGISCYQELKNSRQSIQVSRSFESPLNAFEDIKKFVHTYATKACQNLRGHGLKAKKITVFITTNRFKKDMYKNEHTVELPHASNETLMFLNASTSILHLIFKGGQSYTKTGVLLHDFYKSTNGVLTLDLSHEHNNKPSLDPVLDQLNKRFGNGIIHFGGCHKGLSFGDKKKFMSPCYTTNWNDILVVG